MPAHTSPATPYDLAVHAANAASHELAPFCEEIHIAGSIRRMKSSVKDVEIVCIPSSVPTGLFSDALEVDPGFCAAVNQWPKVKGEPTGRYTQRMLPGGLTLDLFIADRDNWGSILLIRTGDAAFSKHVMGTLLRRQGYRQQDGYVWRGDRRVSVPSEEEMFRLAGLAWITPSQRIGLEPHR